MPAPVQRSSAAIASLTSSRAAVPVALGLLVLAGLLLRLPPFADALFGDELSTYFVVSGRDLGGVLDLVGSEQEQTPPVFFVLAWLADKVGADSSLLRLPSLLAGLALIPVVHLLGTRAAGRGAGLLAAALVTFSPFLIFYSTEARGYGVMTLCAVASTLGLVAGLQTGRRLWWALYAVASCLAMYTHYTAVFLLAAQALWALVLFRAQWRWIAGANAIAVLGFLPWIPEYRDDGSDGAAELIGRLNPLTWDSAVTDVVKVVSGVPYQDAGQTPGVIATLALGAGALAAVAGALLARRRGDDEGRRPLRWAGLFLAGALAAPVLSGLVSLVGPNVFMTRNLITTAPLAALLVATLAVQARGIWRPVAIVLLLGGFAAGGVKFLDRAAHRPDVDAALAGVVAHGSAGDPIVQATPYGPGVLQMVEIAAADRGVDGHPIIRLGSPDIADDAARRAATGPGQYSQFVIDRPTPRERAAEAASAARGGRLWVIATGGRDLLAPGNDNLLTRFTTALPDGWRVTGSRTYPGLLPTTLFELRGPAAG